MSNIASLEDFIAKRRADQAEAPPGKYALAGIVVFSDGSWRVTEQAFTGAEFEALFSGLATACGALRQVYEERMK